MRISIVAVGRYSAALVANVTFAARRSAQHLFVHFRRSELRLRLGQRCEVRSHAEFRIASAAMRSASPPPTALAGMRSVAGRAF